MKLKQLQAGANERGDRDRRRPRGDSVDLELTAWLAELPGVSPDTEAARMRLARLGRQFDRMLAQIARSYGMTIGDWQTLSVLQRAGPPHTQTPRALAGAMGVTSGTMSIRLARLVKAGLVEQVQSTADARSRPVRLTTQGHFQWRSATADRTRIERELIERTLGAHRVALLNSLLRRLMIAFESGFGPAPPRPEENALVQS